MARILGVQLPDDKRMEIALTYIYGIGRITSQRILADTKVDPNKRVKNLTEEETLLLQKKIEQYPVEGVLRKTSNDSNR
jgi:small subunit ribosomal protein S13